jgi:hypothetical protein
MTTIGKRLHTTTNALMAIAVMALSVLGVTALIDPSFVRGSMGGGIAGLGMELVAGGKGPLFARRDADHPGLQPSFSAAPDARPIGASPSGVGPASNAANGR